MTTTCWNDKLIIKAENEQDAVWFTGFIANLENINIFSGHMELQIGEFDEDGTLSIITNHFYIEDFKKNFYGKVVYVETDKEEHTGNEGFVVGLTFSILNGSFPDEWNRLLKKEMAK